MVNNREVGSAVNLRSLATAVISDQSGSSLVFWEAKEPRYVIDKNSLKILQELPPFIIKQSLPTICWKGIPKCFVCARYL